MKGLSMYQLLVIKTRKVTKIKKSRHSFSKSFWEIAIFVSNQDIHNGKKTFAIHRSISWLILQIFYIDVWPEHRKSSRVARLEFIVTTESS